MNECYVSGTLPMPQSASVTQLLLDWRAGNQEALDALTPLVYDALRHVARRYMSSESAGHTLQATAVVHEAYERLVEMDVGWRDRAHFFAVASRLMRRILVDHARGHRRDKRGGGVSAISLEEATWVGAEPNPDLVDLDQALHQLASFDERKSKIVELHFFGGLTYEETAEVLGISPATVERELRLAKAWLYRQRGPEQL